MTTAPGHDLPSALTPLVGRTSEIERVRALLASGIRLLTLIGPGGIGKPRSALDVGRHVAGASDG